MVYPEYKFPPYIAIETIRGCNARCVFCPFGTGQLDRRIRLMDDSLFEKISEEVIRHKDVIKRVTLCIYGESLLDRKLEDKIQHLKKGGIVEVAIESNGFLLDEGRARSLLESGVDITRLSMSTLNPKWYGSLRIGLDLPTVITNIERYIRMRNIINPGARIYLYTEHSPGVPNADIEQWKQHWVPLVKPHDMIKTAICLDITEENRRSIESERWDTSPCSGLFQTMNIIYNGKVIMCCADFKDEDTPYKLGNAKCDSLENIWKCERARHYRELHRRGLRNDIELCIGCDIWNNEKKQNTQINSNEIL